MSDYSAHWEQYAEQLSLRLMSGDVGDIVLLNGSGLEVSAVLESDAMADLTPYLEQCPYRDELDEELLQPLTNSAGRLCGVPLGVSPQYLIYNETLGQSLGLTWDTDALTWKDLLDLATVWQAAGEASPSLFCTGTARTRIRFWRTFSWPIWTAFPMRLRLPHWSRSLRRFKRCGTATP